jgi:hypothetical protein
MVGIRIAPDNNDIVVWRLDEAAAPFVNSSTSSSSPGSSANLTVLSGSPLLQQPSPFAASGTNSSVQFTGNDSGSPRNTINGAVTFLPQPPLTVSMWVMIRNYDTTGFTQHGLAKQTTLNTWSGTSFSSINLAQNERYNGSGIANTSKFDFSVVTSSSNTGGNANSVPDQTITLYQWHHVGLTYDGTTVLGYINGNNISTATASPTGNIFYAGSPGPWFIGAIPTASGNPEESNMSFCDIRFANVIRPQSYFQNIYTNGALNNNVIALTRYYKMRAFDLSCRVASPVYWVDTAVRYTNAPSPPCGGPLGPIEIMETYVVPNG